MRLMTALLLCALALAGASCTRAQPVPTVRVEVWHDTVCPWCRIGLHTLDTVIAGAKDVRVEVVHHPFLLDPETPPGGRDLRAHLGSKFGPDRLEAMFQRVSAAGAAAGVHFDWEKVRRAPDTTASHTLIDWAPPEVRPRLVEALHRAHFEAGQDLGEVEVLVGLAGVVGLDATAAKAALEDPARRQATRAAALSAAHQGITGVPHFVIGARTLDGAQPADALAAAIREASRAR